MREKLNEIAENGRIKEGYYASDASYGPNGAFVFIGPFDTPLRVIACDGLDDTSEGWEHVSVSTDQRIPRWIEMCFVKDLFWHEEECVIQFHPPKSQYVNQHPYCLHLWRRIGSKVELPPTILLGGLTLKV